VTDRAGVIYLRRWLRAALLFPIFAVCLWAWGYLGAVIYVIAMLVAYAIQDWVVRRRGLPPVER